MHLSPKLCLSPIEIRCSVANNKRVIVDREKIHRTAQPLPPQPVTQTEVRSAAHDAQSAKVIQTVLKTFVSESYRMAQDSVKDRLAGIRHLFRV